MTDRPAYTSLPPAPGCTRLPRRSTVRSGPKYSNVIAAVAPAFVANCAPLAMVTFPESAGAGASKLSVIEAGAGMAGGLVNPAVRPVDTDRQDVAGWPVT